MPNNRLVADMSEFSDPAQAEIRKLWAQAELDNGSIFQYYLDEEDEDDYPNIHAQLKEWGVDNVGIEWWW